ncbi:glycosyltransferase family 9 protein [bacterium]|nr:glycosyltransferase family 9 protein [bacterium]
MAKILIIRLTSLGDVIFTLPLVNILKKNGHQVDFAVSERGIGVIENNPYISNVHFVPLMKWRKQGFSWAEFLKLIRNLRAENYDIALDCQQMFKSLFLFAFCGAKRRITFKDARELSVFGGNEFVKPKAKFRDYNYHIVERNLDFARHLGINPDEIKFPLPQTPTDVTSLLKDIDKNKKTVVISPATTWKNKHWDIEHWKVVADYVSERYNLIFTGTDKDINLIKNISEKGINLAGKTNLPQLLEVFKSADLVISPDSGSSNLAWSSGKPALITIFTCTPSKRFGAYGDDDKYFTLQGNLPCQPCFKKKCQNRHCNCTKNILPDEIIKIVNNVLG